MIDEAEREREEVKGRETGRATEAKKPVNR